MRINLKRLTHFVIILLLFLCISMPEAYGAGSPVGADTKAYTVAVEKLTKAGIFLQKDPEGKVRWIEAPNGEIKDEHMPLLARLPFLEWLEIGKSSLSPAGIKHLRECINIRRLYIHDINLEGQELKWISGLKRLEALSLQHTGITGKFLNHLTAHDSLRVLNISGNPVSDKDMFQISRFPNLEVLALADTQVTGRGIAGLAGMARLNELNIQNCPVGDDGASHFLSMPNLRIVYASGSNLSDVEVRNVLMQFPSLAIFR